MWIKYNRVYLEYQVSLLNDTVHASGPAVIKVIEPTEVTKPWS